MKTRSLPALVAAALAGLVTSMLVAAPAGAQTVPQDGLVSAVPSAPTPNVLDGDVYAIAQVGTTVVLGGSFTQAQDAGTDEPVLTRTNLLAYDSVTGRISQTFVPEPDGIVRTLAAGPGNTVYVGGHFNNVAGRQAFKITRLDVTTGQVVTPFNPRVVDAAVWDVKLSGDRLFIAGLFTTVNKVARKSVAELDPVTGALRDGFTVPFEGNVWGGATQVTKLDVTPDGSRLVAIGNFRSVGGQPRWQVALVDLTVPGGEVTSWRTTRWEIKCGSSSSTKYDVRDVDFAPDGSYFVIGATGGHPAQGALCDGVSRWETARTGGGQEPTWFDLTGGDSVYSVAATQGAVYVGGHFRWLNNPIYVQSYKGPGAVDREGIAAVDPVNGVPLSWNPGRDRGRAVWDMVSTPTQLLVGSDTDRIGRYLYRGRIAAFPLATGSPVPQPRAATLPADVYRVGPSGASASLSRVPAFSGSAPAPASVAVPGQSSGWSDVTGAFVADGRLYALRTNRTMTVQSFDGSVLGEPSTVDLLGLTSFANEMPSVTSLFYDEGRMFYTLANQNALYMRYLTVESTIVGATRFTVASGTASVDWRNARGAFLAGGSLFVGSTSGSLVKLGWSDRAPVTTGAQTVSGPSVDGRTWSSKALFAVPAAAAPQVSVDRTCTGTACTFSAVVTGVDPASVTGYSWQLGDGSTATGQSVSRNYSPGTYTAQVTVTTALTSGTGSTTVTVANAAPTAAGQVACAGSQCTFTAAASTDADGSVTGWSWDLGDGSTTTGQTVTHTYASSGDVPVTLTVTDDRGATATASVTATPRSTAVQFVGSSANSAQVTATTRSVGLPVGTAAGDVLTLFAISNGTTTLSAPAGWTSAGTVSSVSSTTAVWTRTATATDAAGGQVAVTSSSLTKAEVVLAAYRGATSASAVVARETATTTDHATPTVTAATGGGWLVSFWADKSASTASWTNPAGTTVRSTAAGTGAGHLSHLLADSGGPVAAGAVGGLVARASSASANAGMVSVLLVP